MIVYKRLIIDIASNKVLYQEPFEYAGPIAHMKGKKAKMKKIEAPPASFEETEFRRQSLSAQKLAMHEQGYEWNSKTGEFEKRPLSLLEQQEEQDRQDLYKNAIAKMKMNLGEVTPAQEEAINRVYNAADIRGRRDIGEFLTEQRGARGLSIEDTPIAREAARAISEHSLGLESAKAASKFNVGEAERMFGERGLATQENLRQRRFQNIFNVGGQTGGQTIGFMQARAGLKPTIYQKPGSSGFLGSGGLGLIGGALQGAGAFFGGK